MGSLTQGWAAISSILGLSAGSKAIILVKRSLNESLKNPAGLLRQ